MMVLENERCHTSIRIDEAYALGSADHAPYDAVLNPCRFRPEDDYRTLSIHIRSLAGECRLAQVGPFCCSDIDCAMLDGDVLTVLQGELITQISVMDASLLRHAVLDAVGASFAIRKVEKGYVIHGETEILMLDAHLQQQWSFAGKDIFASLTGKEVFAIRGNTICLYDFEDNYYEIDLDGNPVT